MNNDEWGDSAFHGSSLLIGVLTRSESKILALVVERIRQFLLKRVAMLASMLADTTLGKNRACCNKPYANGELDNHIAALEPPKQ